MAKTNLIASSLAMLVAFLPASTSAGATNIDELGSKHAKQQTPLSTSQLVRVLRDAHVIVFGFEPNQRRLAMSWAQVGFENGRGSRMWNHNVGNVGPSRKEHNYYFHTRGWKYRSFDGFLEGGIAYWRVLRRCSLALKYFDAGMPNEASISLKRCHYYGTSQDVYASALRSMYGYALMTVLPGEREEAQRLGKD